MDLLNLVKTTSKFQNAIWNRNLSLSNINFLFDLCCASLSYDYNNLPPRNFMRGDKVELTILFGEELKRFYLKYVGIDENKDVKKVVLENDDEKCKTTYRLNASQFIWRLNKCNPDKNLTSTKQLNKYKITSPPIGVENPIKILSNKTNIPYEEYNFFNRTIILLLLKQPIQNFIDALKNWAYEGHSFLDYFPAYFFSEMDHIMKINSEKFDRSDPERILYLFNDQAELLNYINSTQKNFFILSDNYNRFFNPSTSQYFYQTLNNKGNNVKLFYIGGFDDFKKLNKEESFIFSQKITPIIYNDNLQALEKIKNKIFIVGDKTLNDLINDSLLIAKHYRDLNPEFSAELRGIIYSLCSLNKYESDIFLKNFSKLLKQYKSYPIIQKLNDIYLLVKKNNFKNNYDLKSDYLVSDFTPENNTINIIGKKELKSHILKRINTQKFIITFLDTLFYSDILFPAIMLGFISIDNISFNLFTHEYKILLYSLNKFSYKYNKFFNRELKSESLNEHISEEIEEHIKLFELDFSIINSSTFINNQENKVEVITVLSEDDYFEYVSFFTKNYYPTILEDESVFDIGINELEVGHDIIIIPGVRNVLQKFSEIFENKELNFNLKNKWKDALNNFSQQHSFSILVKQLQRFGLNRMEPTIKNWINNSSVIGTLRPKEDFLIIAKATNDPFLLSNYSEVADVCVSLQRMSKILGKKIKKLSMAALKKQNIDEFLSEYDINIQNKIKEIVNNIKVVTVTNIYHNSEMISHSLVNQLIDKDKIWA